MKSKGSGRSLADLGVGLFDEILHLGILLGKANITISTDNKISRGTALDAAEQIILNTLVQGLDERYPDLVELDEEQQQHIINSEVEAMEKALSAAAEKLKEMAE